MEASFSFLASAAEYTSEGKLYVLGGDIDTIYAASLPVTQPALVLVLKLWVATSDLDRSHNLRVSLTDADGTQILPSEPGGPLNLPALQPRQGRRVGIGVVVNMQGITFDHDGEYTFHVRVDDEEVTSVSLNIDRQQR